MLESSTHSGWPVTGSLTNSLMSTSPAETLMGYHGCLNGVGWRNDNRYGQRRRCRCGAGAISSEPVYSTDKLSCDEPPSSAVTRHESRFIVAPKVIVGDNTKSAEIALAIQVRIHKCYE